MNHGIFTRSQQPEAARALIASPAAPPAIRDSGMDPIGTAATTTPATPQ